MERIKIGPDFFAKSILDYSDWPRALVREVLQNAFDAGSTRVDVTTEDNGIKVEDNGCGMTENILREKLLSLGSSGKNFTCGNVGGFGKAKELLYFGQKRYSIYTNGLACHGEGGDYEISANDTVSKGTTSIISFERPKDWASLFKDFLQKCDVGCQVYLNGEKVAKGCKCGELVREWSFGKLYTGGPKDMMLVRVHGIYMHHRYVTSSGLILELNEPSYEKLNANRDSVKWELVSKLDEYANRCATEAEASEPPKKIVEKIWRGNVAALRRGGGGQGGGQGTGSVQMVEYEGACDFMTDFVVESEMGDIPYNWYPDRMTGYQKWIACAWVVAILELQRIRKDGKFFRIGWIFSDNIMAAFGRSSGTYLLNPCKAGTFEPVIEKNRQGASIVLARAIHEYCHDRAGSAHNERFASEQTHLTEQILQEYKDVIHAISNPDRYLKHFIME
jgi:hypothetical protein